MIEVTVLNNRDIELIPGERVKLDIPVHKVLPISVYSLEGVLMGYLGRNDMTCVPGTKTSQEVYDILTTDVLIDAVVKGEIYYATKQRKVIVEIRVEEKALIVA